MAQDHFIEKHKTAWQRLEDLLKLLDSSSLRRLHREEVRELGRIYRRTASDLAIARAESSARCTSSSPMPRAPRDMATTPLLFTDWI